MLRRQDTAATVSRLFPPPPNLLNPIIVLQAESASLAVSVLHALHAVNDVDAGGQVVPLLGKLYAVKVVDALLAGGHVGCHGADAVGDRLDHNLRLKQLAIQDYRLLVGIELRTDGLCDGAVVEDEVADE